MIKDSIAKPGDIIKVTNSGLTMLFEHELIVVEHSVHPIHVDDFSNCIWCRSSNGELFWFNHGDYKIIKRANVATLVSCPDCHGTGKIELFTSTVECTCCQDAVTKKAIDSPVIGGGM